MNHLKILPQLFASRPQTVPSSPSYKNIFKRSNSERSGGLPKGFGGSKWCKVILAHGKSNHTPAATTTTTQCIHTLHNTKVGTILQTLNKYNYACALCHGIWRQCTVNCTLYVCVCVCCERLQVR